jgi:Flp pilus assembly protein TadG
MSRRSRKDQEGSLTVELVVLTPVLFLLVITALVFGRVSEARQQVIEAARAGAEAAAVLPDGDSARTGAAAAAVVGLFNRAHTCARARVDTDLSRFYAGGSVRVTVACQVELSDVTVPGVPGSTTVTASSTAPIDPYRAVR